MNRPKGSSKGSTKDHMSLRELDERVTATQLYHDTKDHALVAQTMGIPLKKAYQLIDDELTGELQALRGADSEDLSALQMHEFLSLKKRLQAWLKDAEDGDKPEATKVAIVKEIRSTLMAIDSHLEKTGKFVKKEEIHFSWEDHGDDPELQNLFLGISDFFRVGHDVTCPKCTHEHHVSREPQELFDYINQKVRDDALERAKTQDVNWKEVVDEAEEEA